MPSTYVCSPVTSLSSIFFLFVFPGLSTFLFQPLFHRFESQLFRVQSSLFLFFSVPLFASIVARYSGRAFSNPSTFKYSYQFWPSPFVTRTSLGPSSYPSADQRANTNRGCIQRASSLSLSRTLSASSDIVNHHPSVVSLLPTCALPSVSSQLLSLSLYSPCLRSAV